MISLCLKIFENAISHAYVLANPLTPTHTLVPNRVPLLSEQHTEPSSVLPPRGALMGQPELWSAPAQHDPDQREAAGTPGWAVLPILTGEHCVPLGYSSCSGLKDKRMARSDPPVPSFRCIFVTRPQQRATETSAVLATSWFSASTRRLPTRAPYRYLRSRDYCKGFMRHNCLTLICFTHAQLLKGVGTKCWAPDAEYALHSVYQGGLFELRAGDELFVSVSSPTMVNADDSSSYFGAFRLDL